ncbi:MAG TPA: polyprenol monophosphomannose synthase [Pyrinomonadaceae bacterium]|jgi:dolichol-phosphate mannosyltransferase|nr:polyprenol monophosphomannose synthase [Pyrinomonadaceae bacterium]
MNTNRTLIIVPTYNERENAPALVERILAIVPDADVLLVDDNSPDGTADYAEQLFAAEPRFSVLRRTGARGLGRSYVDGYRKALEGGYARLIQMDADFSHDPASLPLLIAASRTADVVIGSRYCAGGGIENWPLRRQLLSRFANRYVCAITGLKIGDTTSGFRCYSQRALRHILEGLIVAEGYAFLVEATYRTHRGGLAITEVPITFTDRREGQSKISRAVILESVLMPWRLRFGRRGGGGDAAAEMLSGTQDEVAPD